jgi:hypothetical protein
MRIDRPLFDSLVEVTKLPCDVITPIDAHERNKAPIWFGCPSGLPMASMSKSAVNRPPIAKDLRKMVACMRHCGSISASTWASSRSYRSQYVQSCPVQLCPGRSSCMSPIESNSEYVIVPLFLLVASVLAEPATRNRPRRRHPANSFVAGTRLPLRWYVCGPSLVRRRCRVKVFSHSGVLGIISGDHRSRENRLYARVGLPSRITIKACPSRPK